MTDSVQRVFATIDGVRQGPKRDVIAYIDIDGGQPASVDVFINYRFARSFNEGATGWVTLRENTGDCTSAQYCAIGFTPAAKPH